MSLRLQLLAFAALTLVLPWAGIRFVVTVEESFRSELETALTRSASVVAQGIAQVVAADDTIVNPVNRPSNLSSPLYLHPLSRPPAIDGARDDWRYERDPSEAAAAEQAMLLDDGSRIWLGINSGFLYLFVQVPDDEVVHQAAPGRPPHGDRIVLLYGPARDPGVMLLASRSDGAFNGQPSSGGDRYIPTGDEIDNVAGAWEDLESGGYAIEARVPLDHIGGLLGIGIIDSDERGATARLASWTWDENGAPNLLISESPTLARAFRAYSGGTDRYRVFDGDGWVLADTGALDTPGRVDEADDQSLIERVLQQLLRRDDPDYAQTLLSEPGRIGDAILLTALEGERPTTWYRRANDGTTIVAAAVPVDPSSPRRGAVLVEEASDPILTLRSEAMLDLVTMTLLVSIPGMVLLLGYASLLAFRIRRLARAAESALGPRGEIDVSLPGNRASDEIGDLARSFGGLLGRLRDYTEYLQSLKSKLSHELRTPLAIVATSADNLEHEMDSETGKTYLARLRQGATRLESILQAMTAATRVEQAITQTELETFDLTAVVKTCVASYADVYSSHRFELALPREALMLRGSAELLAQMLDKLVDNAAGFAAAESAIEIGLSVERSQVRLDVVNSGPLLPEAMRHQLFDSLVSVREREEGERTHLGLGLYIVTLVAEFHGGHVSAENLDDASGVRFTVELPLQ